MDVPAAPNAVAETARECQALRHAHVLAEWVGSGKSVTAKGVLRRADVPPAGQALGITVPNRLRSAADVPDLHRPWTAALELGLLSANGKKVMAGPTTTNWPTVTDEEVLDSWARALVFVLAETFDTEVRAEAWELGRMVLAVLSTNPALAGDELLHAIRHAAIHTRDEVFELMLGGFGSYDPSEIVLGILATFGAVTEDEQHPAITALGHWALTEITSSSAALSTAGPPPNPS